MDYEKKYKEAINRAKAMVKVANSQEEIYNSVITIFPELKESEDKMIREYLIRYIDNTMKSSELKSKLLAWLENIPYTIDHEKREGFHLGYKAGLEKQGEQKPIINVPPREVILAIWDLGNEWKELTNGSISTEYGTQLDYIQKHWHESEYYLREKQGEQKPAWSREDEKIRQTIINEFKQCSEWYCSNGLTKEDCINWLNKQEYFEWGDEDNENMNSLCVLLDQMVSINAIGNEHSIEYKNWLKSIKQRMGG